MFYVIYNRDTKEWIWIKSKSEAVLAAEVLSRKYEIILRSSDGFGNYVKIPFKKEQNLSLFDTSFYDLFEKYVYHDASYDFYAYRLIRR